MHSRKFTDNEDLARSGVRADGVREVYRVRAGVRSLRLLIDKLWGYISRLELDSLAGKNFLAVDRPVRSRLRISCIRHRDSERFSSNHGHVADAEVTRDLRWDWNKTIDMLNYIRISSVHKELQLMMIKYLIEQSSKNIFLNHTLTYL